METTKSYRTELEKRVKASFKQQAISIKDGAKLLNMSPSKLHDVFKNHDSIDDLALHKFATYLKVDVEYVKTLNSIKLSDNSKQQKKEPVIIDEVKQVTKPNRRLIAGLFLCVSFILALFITVNFYQIKTTNYQGIGRDLSPQQLSSEQFNLPLYLYDIRNFVLEKENNELTMTADLFVIDAVTKEVVISGAMKGIGFYYGDQASMSYKVENASNGESWTGVFMLDAPDSGDLKGYWLTSHNDTNSKYGFRYLIGEVLAERCDISKDTCVAPVLSPNDGQ